MNLGISTRWNTYRHSSGEELLTEILDLGLSNVELGYDLTLDLVPDIRRMVEEGTIVVRSVHNFCPVPLGAPFGHPELFPLTSLDRHEHAQAVRQTIRTVEFASELGASCVIVHAGQVRIGNLTRKLISLWDERGPQSPPYERLRMKLIVRRERKAQRHLDQLYRAIEELLPSAAEGGVRLALENLPSWEAMPTESELEGLFRHFDSAHLAYWHDTGHAQVRQNLGFTAHYHWFERLEPWLAGLHVHDVLPPARDHLVPGEGEIDFARFKSAADSGRILILEPAPGTPGEKVRAGMEQLKRVWDVPE